MTRLPLGWEWTTLGEIAENVKNGIFISRPGTEPRGVPILRISSVRPMRLNVEDIRYSSLESAELAQRDALLSSGDLLFTRYSGNPEYVGACAVVPEGTGQLTYPDKLIRVRLDARTADPRFVAPTFAWEGVKAQVRSVVKTTAGQVGISGRDLRSIRIPLSSLAEQRRIVAVLEDHLSRLDKATQYLNRVRTNIRTLTGAVRETEVGRSREHPLPNGWRWGLIRDVIVEIEAGKSFACESRPARDDEWGVIKVSAMTWGEFREAENKAVPPGRFVDSRHEIRPGDILISRANTPAYVGASVLVPKCRPKLILSDKSLRLRLRPDVDRDWLSHALSAPSTRQRISARATGTKDSMRNISQQSLLDVDIPIPPEPEQRILGARVRARLESIEQTKQELNRREGLYEELRQSIFTAAFSGQLVAQDPNDEPAARLMARIRGHRAAKGDSRRTRRATTRSVKENRQQETLL